MDKVPHWHQSHTYMYVCFPILPEKLIHIRIYMYLPKPYKLYLTRLHTHRWLHLTLKWPLHKMRQNNAKYMESNQAFVRASNFEVNYMYKRAVNI